MFKRLAKSPIVPYIGGTLIWAYMALLSRTMRWKVEGLEQVRPIWEADKPFILACWHSRILLLPVIKLRLARRWKARSTKPALMVSTSRDGEFTKRAGSLLGLHIIRGSAARKDKADKDKRGFAGAREAMQHMGRGGAICLTVDGPRGPREIVGIGPVKLAQQLGMPIVIYGQSAVGKRLNTWDRLIWPLPFARGAIVFGETMETSKTMDSEELRAEVERRLHAATVRANALCGVVEEPAPAAVMASAPTTPTPAPVEQQEKVLKAAGALGRGGP
jgi:lysophospholipid acyltransferase (LPLAT)-like uncharacterized protein